MTWFSQDLRCVRMLFSAYQNSVRLQDRNPIIQDCRRILLAAFNQRYGLLSKIFSPWAYELDRKHFEHFINSTIPPNPTWIHIKTTTQSGKVIEIELGQRPVQISPEQRRRENTARWVRGEPLI